MDRKRLPNPHDHLDEMKLRMAKAVLKAADLPAIRAKSLANIERWKAQGVWVSAFDEWQELMANGSDDAVLAAMTGRDQTANRLRQSPPYSGFLSEDVRQKIVKEKEMEFVTRVFLDTEFTDFEDCELISIGVVSEDGREFYAERTDYDLSKCNDFVRETVLPLLGQEPAFVGTLKEIGSKLQLWLGQFDQVEICVDYSKDYELFGDLVRDPWFLDIHPAYRCRNIWNDIAAVDLSPYWAEQGRHEHHALHDARANKYAFECSIQAASSGAGNAV